MKNFEQNIKQKRLNTLKFIISNIMSNSEKNNKK